MSCLYSRVPCFVLLAHHSKYAPVPPPLLQTTMQEPKHRVIVGHVKHIKHKKPTDFKSAAKSFKWYVVCSDVRCAVTWGVHFLWCALACGVQFHPSPTLNPWQSNLVRCVPHLPFCRPSTPHFSHSDSQPLAPSRFPPLRPGIARLIVTRTMRLFKARSRRHLAAKSRKCLHTPPKKVLLTMRVPTEALVCKLAGIHTI